MLTLVIMRQITVNGTKMNANLAPSKTKQESLSALLLNQATLSIKQGKHCNTHVSQGPSNESAEGGNVWLQHPVIMPHLKPKPTKRHVMLGRAILNLDQSIQVIVVPQNPVILSI